MLSCYKTLNFNFQHDGQSELITRPGLVLAVILTVSSNNSRTQRHIGVIEKNLFFSFKNKSFFIWSFDPDGHTDGQVFSTIGLLHHLTFDSYNHQLTVKSYRLSKNKRTSSKEWSIGEQYTGHHHDSWKATTKNIWLKIKLVRLQIFSCPCINYGERKMRSNKKCPPTFGENTFNWDLMLYFCL